MQTITPNNATLIDSDMGDFILATVQPATTTTILNYNSKNSDTVKKPMSAWNFLDLLCGTSVAPIVANYDNLDDDMTPRASGRGDTPTMTPFITSRIVEIQSTSLYAEEKEETESDGEDSDDFILNWRRHPSFYYDHEKGNNDIDLAVDAPFLPTITTHSTMTLTMMPNYKVDMDEDSKNQYPLDCTSPPSYDSNNDSAPSSFPPKIIVVDSSNQSLSSMYLDDDRITTTDSSFQEHDKEEEKEDEWKQNQNNTTPSTTTATTTSSSSTSIHPQDDDSSLHDHDAIIKTMESNALYFMMEKKNNYDMKHVSPLQRIAKMKYLHLPPSVYILAAAYDVMVASHP